MFCENCGKRENLAVRDLLVTVSMVSLVTQPMHMIGAATLPVVAYDYHQKKDNEITEFHGIANSFFIVIKFSRTEELAWVR